MQTPTFMPEQKREFSLEFSKKTLQKMSILTGTVILSLKKSRNFLIIQDIFKFLCVKQFGDGSK